MNKYVYADPERIVGLALKNNPELLRQFILDLKPEGGKLILHFDAFILRKSLHYNDVYEFVRREFPQTEVITCE